MKSNSRFCIITLIVASLLLLSAIAITSPAASSEYSSSVITEDRGNLNYAIAPSFDVELDASYGEFDTDRDGANDFTGIAVDMRITNISAALPYGIAGIDARLCFDNTRLEPLYKTSTELNGSGLNSPAPVTNFPTYHVRIPAAGLELDVFSIEGLCKAYAHTDGSYSNPDNENQYFTGPDSYVSCNYVINLETHVSYKENKVGLVSADNVSFRYYFKVLDEIGAGSSYTFTVPDSPDATLISDVALKAPHYTGGSPSFSNVAGRGDSVTIKLWNDAMTTTEHTTKAPEPDTEEVTTQVTTSVTNDTTEVPTTPDITTTVEPESSSDVSTITPSTDTSKPTDTTVIIPSGDTTLPTDCTTVKPEDAVVSDETTVLSPEGSSADSKTDETTHSEGGSCGAFTQSALIPALGFLLIAALAIARKEKSNDKKNY